MQVLSVIPTIVSLYLIRVRQDRWPETSLVKSQMKTEKETFCSSSTVAELRHVQADGGGGSGYFCVFFSMFSMLLDSRGFLGALCVD